MSPRLGVFLALLSLPATPARAQGLAIEHGGVGCVLAGQFPRIDASVGRADQVAKARTYFHADGESLWYYVDMKPAAGTFQGVLPKPLKTAKRIHYYVEITDKAANQTRTQEYAPDVVADAGACSNKGVVAAAAIASKVAVGAPLGASAAPAGFAANTVVVAAGGGVGATALVVGALAVAGGGAAVVASKAGDKGDEGVPDGGSNQPLIFVQGTVYSDACCVAGIVDPNNRANSRRIQGAFISSSLDSATATSDGQGVFRLNTQTRCSGVGSGQEFTLTIAAPGCDTLSVARTWGCASSGPNIYALNLACR